MRGWLELYQIADNQRKVVWMFRGYTGIECFFWTAFQIFESEYENSLNLKQGKKIK